jgi:hypothetical protein
MNDFARTLARRVESYVELQCSLGYAFRKQRATMRAFVRYVRLCSSRGR